MLKTTSDEIAADIQEIFNQFSALVSLKQRNGLPIDAPAIGEPVAWVARDDAQAVGDKVELSERAQQKWETVSRQVRGEFLNFLSDAVKRHQDAFSALITYEGGKKPTGASTEVTRAWGVLTKTVQDALLPDLPNLPHLQRERNGQPAGVVGLITSFNFPLAVASWNLAPALLAGNSVVWKPSEKTPLTALAYKGIFDKTAEEFNKIKDEEIVPADLLTIVVGEREIGEALVAHKKTSLVSATGSSAMGASIRRTWENKENNDLRPILELGGNNAVVISKHCDSETLEFAVNAVLTSVMQSGGQFCTNTRRLIVHEDVYSEVLGKLRDKFQSYISGGAIQNPLLGDVPGDKYHYAPLIDKPAFDHFQQALAQASREDGAVQFGGRVLAPEYPAAYYVQPAIVEMPDGAALNTAGIMQRETFAPILFVTKYGAGIDQAIDMVNAPPNARLVNGLYSQSAREIDVFTRKVKSGDAVINAEIGTVGPMRSEMGFGGHEDSGQGTVLNSADPTGPFTRRLVRATRNRQVALTGE